MKKNLYHAYRVGLSLICVFILGASARLHAQIITTFAGNGSSGYTGDGGPATAASIDYTYGIAADGFGNVYIAEYQYHRIRKINSSGIISTYAGTGTFGYTGDGGPATAAQLGSPYSIGCDAAGNLYINDYGNYHIRKINTAGIISTVCGNGSPGYTGDGGPATAAAISNYYGMAVDPAGNIYFNNWNYWKVRKVDAVTGIISLFAGNGSLGFSGDGGPATAAAIDWSYGLACDGLGNVYVGGWWGGTGYSRIRAINSSGIINTVVGTGTCGSAGDGGPATAALICQVYGMAGDAAGNLYINDWYANRVRRVNGATGIITSIAGTGGTGSSGDGGPATAATFNRPFGLAVDGAANVYIGDYYNFKVREILGRNRPPTFTGGHVINFSVCANSVGDSTNNILSVHDSDSWQLLTWSLLSGPSHGTAAAGTTAPANGAIVIPHGLYYTPTTGYVGADSFKMRVTDGYVSDTTMVYVTVNPLPLGITGLTTCFTGSYTTLSDATGGGAWSSGSPATATISSGTGVVSGLTGGVANITYTLPTGCIATITVNVQPYAGMTISTIAGNGTAAFAGDGSAATAASINLPWGVFVDGTDNKYIADYANHRIRRVNATGTITTIAGMTGSGYSGDGAAATAAHLNNPLDVVTDASGNIYFSDFGNHCIRKISTSGIISTIAGTGTSAGYLGDGGAATAAKFNYPGGLGIDASGNIYVADEWNNRIRKINTSTGIITNIAGSGATGYLAGGFSGDGGQATAAQINYPQDVTVDAAGNIYFTDAGNNRIRRINASGVISTLSGNGSAGFSGEGVAATAGVLNSPAGIVMDPIGNLYFSDDANNRIRKISAAGIITTAAGTGTAGFGGDACAATAATMRNPAGIAADASGNTYFSDKNNQRVRKISNNHAPVFTAGRLQNIAMCQNSTDTLNLNLAITDQDNAQGETWSVLTGPVHGTLAATFTATSTGGAITPAGLYYAPTTGYTGNDSFRVVVTDCSGGADTTKFVIIVNPPPSAIAGVATVCAGVTTTLSDPVGTGTWSSNNTAVATVTVGPAGGGVVTGVSVGTAVITYSPGAGCSVTRTVTVNLSPAAISGNPSVCLGVPVTFTDATSGGTWSSSSAVATVTSGGMVTGASLGTATISYTQGGCPALFPVTVNPLPTYITGITSICSGTTTLLFDGIGGGRWRSSSTAIATADSMSGVVTGTGSGIANITYTLPTGCFTSVGVDIYPLPSAIVAPGTLCTGTATMTFTDPSVGGVWSLSGPSGTATLDSFTGVFSGGASAGTVSILYTLGTGCSVNTLVTVNAGPAAITGPPSACIGSNSTLSDLTPGGTWSSSSPSTATIDVLLGTVRGLSAGTAVITYAVPVPGGGCTALDTINVSAGASVITGAMQVCVGLTTTLHDSVSLGSWASDNLPVATVEAATGIVHGVSAGTALISYTLPSGCMRSVTVTVNSSPGAITGTPRVCVGGTTVLADPVGGGLWSSSSSSTATVAGGTVSGVVTGTVTVTYSLGAGCSVSTPVTVNPLPAIITGTATVCVGNTTTLSDGSPLGAWSTGTTTTATVIPASGVVTGVAAGTTPVTYTLPTGCSATKMVTVHALPSVITGTLSVCPGLSTALGSLPFGGIWATGSGSIATVVSGSGVVWGAAPGTTPVTYTAATGCSRTATVTVNALPTLFTVGGGGNFCAGSAGAHITLSGSTAGVSYQLYNGASPFGTPLTGTGTGLDFGLVTVGGAYTVVATLGCSRPMSGSATITVNPLPAPVTGPATVCVGASMAETDAMAGGTWSSNPVTIATVTPGPSGGGVVWGVATGMAVLTYTLPTGCFVKDTIQVSLSPTAIAGAPVVCSGDTTTLSDPVSGGVWTSSNTAAATIGSLSGVVSGAATTTSTTIITYSLGTGCTVTRVMTVTPAPAAITGASAVCIGSVITLADATPSGSWGSGATGIATVTSGGAVTGVSSGTAIISYTTGTGCAATKTVTVNTAPTVITGPSKVCMGSVITLGNSVGGGVWASGSTAIATVGATGDVTGAGPGTVMITYSTGAGCSATKTITVNAIYPISGPAGLCVGASATLADAAAGGTWNSSSSTVATIHTTSGFMNALVQGTTIITYTTAAGCTATVVVTVNTAPSVITGNLHVCVGASTALSDSAGGGTWTSASPGIATVVSATGVVTGALSGTSVITYSLGSGCIKTTIVTVDPSPAPITGVGTVCVGSTTTLSDATGGGTWMSGSGAVASAGLTTGIVTGLSGGTATITYTPATTGCAAIRTVTVNPVPDPLSVTAGSAALCAGQTVALGASPAGGTWGSSNTSIATVDASGLVTGGLPGVATIAYTLSTGCNAVKAITVNAAPGPISGTRNMCIGASTTLSDATGGGVWGTDGSGIATVTAGGVVTGLIIGTATISYTASGCPATAMVTVNALPGAISGPTQVCVGSAILLTDLPSGGSWSSPSGGGILFTDAVSGAVSGVGAGTAGVTYSLGAGCNVSTMITVNPLPLPPTVMGAASVCAGYTTAYIDGTPGGAWSCSPATVVTITPTGVVTGTGGGMATISYTLGTGCSSTTTLSVTAVPAITGADHVCSFGDTTTVYDALAGGSWSSTLATVSPAGLVTGFGVGVATITYTLGSGCYTTKSMTVNPVPGAVSGNPHLCTGTTTIVSDTTAGGTWSTGAAGIATVSASGTVSGLAAGTAAITYTAPVTGCRQYLIVTVSPLPSAIAGIPQVCVGAATALSDTAWGGTWGSSSAGIAAAGSLTGIVTGMSAGTAVITYYIGAGCMAVKAVTVNPLPAAEVMTGGGNYCAGTGGVHIGLGGSEPGISYGLFLGTALSGTVAGSGSAVDFGLQTAAGVYKVVATNTATACAKNMADSVTVTVTPSVVPVVTVAAIPGTTVCQGVSVSFTAMPVNGGPSPAYQWSVNGTAAGTGSAAYSYTPASHDVISVELTSDTTCAVPNTASGSVTMNVVAPVVPVVTISADPGTTVKPGQGITFTAVVTGGGPSPAYIWKVNGAVVLGVTTSTFTGSFANNDTVSCTVTAGGACDPSVSKEVVVTINNGGVGVGVVTTGGAIQVLPNPNRGTFTIKGALGSAADEEVSVEITDMLGRVVYKDKVTAKHGILDETVQLKAANGMYLLSIQSQSANKVFHIVVEQ